jgi:Fe-S oxidoreductase/FAD/FMN-containing dehydrogenase
MLSNNCGGMHAQYAGIGVENVEAMHVLLYDGTKMQLGWMTDAELEREARGTGRAAEVYAGLRGLRERYAEQIRARFPKLPRRISGYNLDRLLPDSHGRFNIARALAGSEGTCATILDATLRLVDLKPERVVLVVGYEDVYAAGDDVAHVLGSGIDVMALEGMDDILRGHIEKKGGPKSRDLRLLPQGKGWLLIQVGADGQDEAMDAAQRLMEHVKRSPRPVDMKMIENQREQERLWAVRESGLGATAFVPGEPDAWPGWEDSAVRPEQLGDYLRDLRRLFDEHGLRAALYGHFGMGCVHCRISFDLTHARGVSTYRSFMDDATDLITRKYTGSLSGEHGDGQARAPFLHKMFGAELVQAFREFKRIWDPDGRMNPGRIVDTPAIDADLRLGAGYHPIEPQTHFKFPDDHGSFARATLRCVGVGKCRRLETKEDEGVMCPSFLVTEDEQHTTRGRAHLLWEMLRGEGPVQQSWRNDAVKESLDLCLACKGCKGDCPVQVDMATYKAEFLSHYYKGRVRPRSAYAFGLIDKWSRLASLAPGLLNMLTHAPGTRSLAKLAANVHPARTLPYFAPRTFRSWFTRRGRRPESNGSAAQRVMLWPDTFNDHFHPEVAQAAVETLEQLGFEVIIPDRPACCGRPLYDFGMLDLARSYLERTLQTLRPAIEAGIPMVVLEPSCWSVFHDEMRNLMPERQDAKRLREQTRLFSEFVMERVPKARIPRLPLEAIVQGHCHHKSLIGMESEAQLLEAMGIQHQVLDSGCCGMAGAFGFETSTHDVGCAAGERVLLPAVRDASSSTLILADGFSCKTQIEQGSNRHALHIAQALRLAFDQPPDRSPGGGSGESIEIPLIRKRERALNASMLRTAAFGCLLTAAAAGAWTWRHTRTR